MKVRDVITRVEEDGWVLNRMSGSHRQYKYPTKLGLVTIAGHPGKDMPIDTLKSVFREAQLEEEA